MEQGWFFSVLDIKSAYRSVNIFPENRPYQCFVWNVNGSDEWPVDNCLCFGLKCAPFIYTQLTEFVVRCLDRRGVHKVFGYLDDFLVIGDAEIECKQSMSMLINLLLQLGFFISWKKVVPPTQKVVYLGVELDSLDRKLRLPERKLDKLIELVTDFENKTICRYRDLQVLCGHLAHASIVVKGGRTFFRRIINLTKFLADKGDVCHIPDWFRADISWWVHLCEIFNGEARLISDVSSAEFVLETDSSMTGFGAPWESLWFLGVWHLPFPPITLPIDHYGEHLAFPPDDYLASMDINVLELGSRDLLAYLHF